MKNQIKKREGEKNILKGKLRSNKAITLIALVITIALNAFAWS